jgi:transglutaminase-like putative cysteine protease
LKYAVTHRTVYRYDDVVSSSYGQLHVLPRDLPGQICHASRVTVAPEPDERRERLDFFGNRVVYFEIRSSHRDLTVTADSEVSVDGRPSNLPLAANQPWENARVIDRLDPETVGARSIDDYDAEAFDARQFALDSPLACATSGLAGYAAATFTPGRPVLDALTELVDRIHADFTYRPGATTVATTAVEVLAGRAGVCQDFAHLAIGCLRALGLAARYVSGYLETSPPPGAERLRGADVSHAWASLFVPGAGWVDLDPTNRQLVNDRYITAAWGRDYGDVPPLKGVIFTDGTKHDLDVEVDVVRLADDSAT